MTPFILGIPKGKEKVRTNIITFQDQQTAGTTAANACTVYHNTVEEAKDKFMELQANDFNKTAHA